MPNHSSRSSEKSSLFRRSKTLPTGSYRRFTTPLIPTYRYESASDLRQDGGGVSCGSDTTNFASAPSQVLATQSPSQRITRLWTHFSLTHCVCYLCLLKLWLNLLVFRVVSIDSDLCFLSLSLLLDNTIKQACIVNWLAFSNVVFYCCCSSNSFVHFLFFMWYFFELKLQN